MGNLFSAAAVAFLAIVACEGELKECMYLARRKQKNDAKGQILAYRAMHMCPNSYSHSVLPHQSAKKVTALAKTPLYCLFLVFLEMKSYTKH